MVDNRKFYKWKIVCKTDQSGIYVYLEYSSGPEWTVQIMKYNKTRLNSKVFRIESLLSKLFAPPLPKVEG